MTTTPADIGWFRHQRFAIGTITPSANLTVERITHAILSKFPEVSGHYSRTPVSGSQDPVPYDYDWDGMLAAAQLLGDAKVDVIVWNGSKGAGLGFAPDNELCRRITERTGIRATTSMVALHRVLQSRQLKRVAVISPYTASYQARLIEGFVRAGYECVAEAHADIADNLAYSTVSDDAIVAMVEAVALSRPDAILTICTNFPAAHLVNLLEARLGIPIFDSVSIGVWDALRLAGISTERAEKWGSLFADTTMR